MNEQDWLACTDPIVMLNHLLGKTSLRKLAMFGCACARHGPQHRLSAEWQVALALAERFADGLASAKELQAAGIPRDEGGQSNGRRTGHQVWRSMVSVLLDGSIPHVLMAANTIGKSVLVAANDTRAALRAPVGEENRAARPAWAMAMAAGRREEAYQCAILRDIVGNPFHPAPTMDPGLLRWQGGCVLKMAKHIYGERTFDELPMLADALEEGGCEDEEVLGHCRAPGPHARGCWVTDLILGKG
jgi:hypothetical protein